MEVDKTTLDDLSIFNSEEEFSVLHKLDLTLTSNGRNQLYRSISVPMKDINTIQGIQTTLQLIGTQLGQWPSRISNGTIKVVEGFYETGFDPIPENPSSFTAYSYKFLHGADYSFVRYSLTHCFDFLKGLKELGELLGKGNIPVPLKKLLVEIEKINSNEHLAEIAAKNNATDLSLAESLRLARFLRLEFKQQMFRLLQAHAQLDAWYSMAMAIRKYNLVFPQFIESPQPFIQISALHHLLLEKPVKYDVNLNRQTNFMFLTGANMAGKSTFIKAVGVAVFLAHAGMGVPASNMELSIFDGMLSNINVMDNIIKGESYFFNEVQRIKSTIQKVNDSRKWLILIDELFKGTNVQDAMKCSLAVIEGLLKIRNSIFILSTHLYEIGESLKVYPNIHFNYFETTISNEQISFNYQLREGISNDRLGFLILKKEGVVKMLEDLP